MIVDLLDKREGRVGLVSVPNSDCRYDPGVALHCVKQVVNRSTILIEDIVCCPNRKDGAVTVSKPVGSTCESDHLSGAEGPTNVPFAVIVMEERLKIKVVVVDFLGEVVVSHLSNDRRGKGTDSKKPLVEVQIEISLEHAITLLDLTVIGWPVLLVVTHNFKL